MRQTPWAFPLLFVSVGCVDRYVVAVDDGLDETGENAWLSSGPADETWVTSGGEGPRVAGTASDARPSDTTSGGSIEPFPTSEGTSSTPWPGTSTADSFGPTLGRPRPDDTTAMSSSGTMSGSWADTTSGEPDSATEDDSGTSTEGGATPWTDDLLQVPDLPLPEPTMEPECARAHWLPRWAVFSALSADGSTVLGTYTENFWPDPRSRNHPGAHPPPPGRAFIWQNGRFETLDQGTVGVGVDDTGSTVLVQVDGSEGSEESQPSATALWRPPAELVSVLPDVNAIAISGDGTTIVGSRRDEEFINENRTVRGFHALRWSPVEGIELAPFAQRSEDQAVAAQTWWAVAASGDTSVVVGARSSILYQCTICPPPQSVLWDGPDLSYGTGAQQVLAVSRDGSTAVGYTTVYPRPHRAMRWNLELGVMEELDLEGMEIQRRVDTHDGSPADEYSTTATDVSSDGAWVLTETVLWRADAPPIAITEVLEASCIAPEAWIPDAVWYGVRISVERRTLVGCARRRGEDLCWIATNVTFD